ncbi:MAG: hypothetical protein LC634_02620 [Sphingomonadales bacterium]|nr:hypothetical protein [Sphingomonadales bacterium]
MTAQTRNDPEYLQRRHAQELEQAQKATHDKARAAHATLADRFAAMLRQTA